MSDYLNPDLDNMAMTDLETNEGLFGLSFWDDPALIGPPFDFEDLASPGIPDNSKCSMPVCGLSSMSPYLEAGTGILERDQGLSLLPSIPHPVGSGSDPEAAPSLTPPQPGVSSHHTPASTPEHAAVITEAGYVCIECGSVKKTKSDLDYHGSTLRHSPFACTCGRSFSRSDVLTRHLGTKNNAQPRHPCPYCKRHRGKSAFHRRDHLKQHIVEYHKFDDEESSSVRGDGFMGVCAKPTCPDYEDISFYCLRYSEMEKKTRFLRHSEYSKHMRDVHSMTPFPCAASGCDRVGAKGYLREKDLVKHHRSMHPDRQPYLPKGGQSHEVLCPYPGCTETHSFWRMQSHARTHLSEEQRLALKLSWSL